MGAIEKSFRGPSRVLAEGNPTDLIAQINAAVVELRAKHESHQADVKKRFDDVVAREQVDRIGRDVGELQASIDELSRRIAASRINGNGGARAPLNPEYSAAFSAHFRTGEVGAGVSLNKGTGEDGGYVVPTEWDRQISDELQIVSPVRAFFDVAIVSGAATKTLVNKHGATSGWVGETDARPQTLAPELKEMQIGWGEIYAMPAATQGLLDDAEINIEAWLASEVEKEFSLREGQAVIAGDGNNKPRGILTFVTGGANAAYHPSGAIGLVNSAAASAVTLEGLIKIVHVLPAEYRSGASFAMNRDTIGKIATIKDADGRSIWMPSAAIGVPSTLMSYPLTEMPDMPDVAANSIPVLFGNGKRAYRIYDRKGSTVLRDPYTLKPYVLFYTTKRVGGLCIDPQAMQALKIAL